MSGSHATCVAPSRSMRRSRSCAATGSCPPGRARASSATWSEEPCGVSACSCSPPQPSPSCSSTIAAPRRGFQAGGHRNRPRARELRRSRGSCDPGLRYGRCDRRRSLAPELRETPYGGRRRNAGTSRLLRLSVQGARGIADPSADRSMAERALLRETRERRTHRVCAVRRAPARGRPQPCHGRDPHQNWQAYNFRDDDGDGRADTWYARERRHRENRETVPEPGRAAALPAVRQPLPSLAVRHREARRRPVPGGARPGRWPRLAAAT